MKKVLFATIVAAAIAGAAFYAFADDNAAYSANAVGVIKYTIPANGGMKCISLPLHPFDTEPGDRSWLFGETAICDQLSVGSFVYFWTGTGWSPFEKKKGPGGKIQWTGGVTNRFIEPGEAFFVKSSTSDKEDKVVSLLGQLPTDESLSYKLSGNMNLDTRGVAMYPVAVTFGDTTLCSELSLGSLVYFWTGTGWSPSEKKKGPCGKIQWTSGATNRVVPVGEGIFIRSAGAADQTITMGIPFDWE